MNQFLKNVKGKRRTNEKFMVKISIVLMTIMLSIGILAPLSQIVIRSFKDNDGKYVGMRNFIDYFSTNSLSVALKNTMFISVTTAIISVTLALFYTYGITRTNMKGKSLFKAIAILPIFAPTMLYGISLMYLFGNQGIVTNYLGINIHLYGPVGIIISEIMYAFPQSVLILLVGFSLTDYRIYEAADTLGTSEIDKFIKITIPSIRYALISSFFVSFTMSFTDFGAPKIVGGNFNVLATDIYKQVIGQQNISMGAAVGIIMLIPAVISFVVDRMISKKQSTTITSKSTTYKIKQNPLRDQLYSVYCIFIGSLILMIIGMAVIASFIKVWPYDMSLTLDHYGFKYAATNGLDTYFNSLKVAILTSIFGTIFTFTNAYLIEKINQFKILRRISYFLSIIPLALPGLVIGLAYILFFNKPYFHISLLNINIGNPFNFLYGTMAILVIANIVHYYSVPFITANTALKMLDKEYEIVGKSMNIPFYKLFMKVTIPMSFPAILEIAVYYFVNAMVTVSAVVFLYTSKLKLASISIVNMEDAGDLAPAAAMAVLILLTNIVVRAAYEHGTRKIKKKTEAWQNEQTVA